MGDVEVAGGGCPPLVCVSSPSPGSSPALREWADREPVNFPQICRRGLRIYRYVERFADQALYEPNVAPVLMLEQATSGLCRELVGQCLVAHGRKPAGTLKESIEAAICHRRVLRARDHKQRIVSKCL